MERNSFLKSLATLVVAPSLISKIDFSSAKAQNNMGPSGFYIDIDAIKALPTSNVLYEPLTPKELMDLYYQTRQKGKYFPKSGNKF